MYVNDVNIYLPRTENALARKQSNYHHGDLRRLLISTAEKIITSQGVEALTLRLLSQRIGVSHTAVYRHFSSKHELFCALALEGFKELVGRFQKIKPNGHNTPRKQISAIGKTYIHFALENPARYRVMFGHVLINQERTPELEQAVGQVFYSLHKVIVAGQANGTVRSGDPGDLTGVGWSMAHGIAQLIIDGQLTAIDGGPAAPTLITKPHAPADQNTERLIDIAVDSMTAGLMKPVEK